MRNERTSPPSRLGLPPSSDLDHVPLFEVQLDAALMVVGEDEHAERFLGNVVGQPLTSLVTLPSAGKLAVGIVAAQERAERVAVEGIQVKAQPKRFLRAYLVPPNGEEGRNRWSVTLLDVSEQRAKDRRIARLERELSTDALTKARNRRWYNYELARSLLRVPRDFPVTLAVLDVDDMHDANQRLGHGGVDDELCRVVLEARSEVKAAKNVVAAMSKVLRLDDCIARTGGDEFVLTLPGADEGHGIDILRRIVERIASKRSGLGVTVSVGASTAVGKVNLRELFDAADRALYAVKSFGKGGLIHSNWLTA